MLNSKIWADFEIFLSFGFSDAILQMKLFFRLKGRLLKFRNFMAPF